MLHRQYTPIEEYKNSTLEVEYIKLYLQVEELKCDKLTVENEGIIEYSSKFTNCEYIRDRDST